MTRKLLFFFLEPFCSYIFFLTFSIRRTSSRAILPQAIHRRVVQVQAVANQRALLDGDDRVPCVLLPFSSSAPTDRNVSVAQ